MKVNNNTTKTMTDVEDAKVEIKKQIEEVDDDLDFGFKSDLNQTSSYDEVWFCKIRSKTDVYFDMTLAGDPPKHYNTKTIKKLIGRLTKIEQSSYVYEGKDIDNTKLHITSEINGKNVLFIVSANYTQISRSLINSLLGCNEPIKKIELGIYQNKSGYASITVLINEKKSNWKYSIEEQRKYIEVIKNKKNEYVSTDFQDYDDLLKEQLERHISILLPEQVREHSVKFVDEKEVFPQDPTSDESTFGEDNPSDFFEIGEE